MLFPRNKLTLLIILSSAIVILFGFFMLLQSYNAREQQKEVLTQQMQLQMQQSHAMQLRMENRIITALSTLKDLQPDLYSRDTQIPDSLKTCIRLSGIDFVVLADQYLIPLATYPQKSTALSKLLPATRDIFNRNPAGEKKVIYYGWIGNILYKITGLETIRTDSSGNRQQYAYLFFGHRFGQQQLNDLAALSGGEASVVKEPSAKIVFSSDNEIINRIPLYGIMTYPIASIQLRTSPAIIKANFRHNLSILLWGIAVMILMISGILFFVRRHYLLPMRDLKLVLLHKNPELFHAKLTGDEDYKSIKNQLLNLFSQQNLLSEFIKRQPSIKTLELHSAILDQINEVVYVTNCDDKIVFWNQAAERYYNISQQSALQQTASALIPVNWESAADNNKVSLTLQEQGCVEGYFSQLMPSGETRQVLLNIIRMFDCTNKPTGNIYILNG